MLHIRCYYGAAGASRSRLGEANRTHATFAFGVDRGKKTCVQRSCAWSSQRSTKSMQAVASASDRCRCSNCTFFGSIIKPQNMLVFYTCGVFGVERKLSSYES